MEGAAKVVRGDLFCTKQFVFVFQDVGTSAHRHAPQFGKEAVAPNSVRNVDRMAAWRFNTGIATEANYEYSFC